jgi:hypothetical protein
MQTIRTLEKTGKDGTLHLHIPLGKPDAEYEVVVVLQPAGTPDTLAPPEERGWPPGYFDRTFGSITDDTFERAPQGELPRPVDLDEGVSLTPFTAVAWSPDGKTIALAGNDARRGGPLAIAIWDAVTGRELRQIPTPAPAQPQRFVGAQGLAFSPDGRTLALVMDQRVSLWEVSTGKQRCELARVPDAGGMAENPYQVTPPSAPAFSPDGRTLAVGCPDETVRLSTSSAGASCCRWSAIGAAFVLSDSPRTASS